jgi:hypothetical protein
LRKGQEEKDTAETMVSVETEGKKKKKKKNK